MPRRVDPNSLAARLRAALLARNRSAADVARVCGFSRQNMQRYLDGEVTRSKHFPAMARALDVALTWFLTGDPATAPSWWNASRKANVDAPHNKDFVEVDPVPLKTSDFPSHWRVMDVPQGLVIGTVFSEVRVILDAHRMPEEGDLVLIPSKDGHRLRRIGPTISGRTVLVSVDGNFVFETKTSPLSNTTSVVVGLLLPQKNQGKRTNPSQH